MNFANLSRFKTKPDCEQTMLINSQSEAFRITQCYFFTKYTVDGTQAVVVSHSGCFLLKSHCTDLTDSSSSPTQLS